MAKRKKQKNIFIKKRSSVFSEVISIILIAFSILMLLSVFSGSQGENIVGITGTAISTVLVGLFGIGAYILPFVLIGVCLYVLLKNKIEFRIYRIVFAFVLFLSFISLWHISSYEAGAYNDLFDFITGVFKDGSAHNGGFFGGIFGGILIKLLNVTGGYIVTVSLIIVSIIMITGKSLINALVTFFENILDMIDSFKEDAKSEVPAKKEINRKRVKEEKNKEDKKISLFIDDILKEQGESVEEREPIIHLSREQEEVILPTEQISMGDFKPKGFDKEPTIIAPKQSEQLSERHLESARKTVKYEFPKISFLPKPDENQGTHSKEEMLKNANQLEETLRSFGVEAKVNEISKGPTVTRYELTPGIGVKVSKILSLSDDLALALAAKGIRIEAPIPGKAAIGIEVPNDEPQSVLLREVISDKGFQTFKSKVAFGLGKDIAGNVIVADIAKMPHLLIAGATGSGKSVCINTLITSILYKATPEEVKFIMVDPKVVELNMYNGIPHLLIPVVTEPKKAAGALNWAVMEMMERYKKFAESGTKNIQGYNELNKDNKENFMPQIVIIIDELADLMMVAAKEVEDSICRLAQLARAAGIHLVIATQRPSVNVITGVIKANIPARIAFAVTSAIDSRTILDCGGAEKLIGKGDMLFKDKDVPMRIQGAFVSEKEVEKIVTFIKEHNEATYDESIVEKITTSSTSGENSSSTEANDGDELTDEIIDFIVRKKKASISLIQRQFKIGFNRAARIIEDLEDRGIIGPEDGAKPRQVLMDEYQWQEYRQRHMDY